MIDDGKNGFLVQLFDQYKFKERLKLLMNNEQLRDEMGRNAIHSVKNQDIEVVADKFFSFISQKNEVDNQRQFHI
jgi:GalNAc-alpha-(1->4)-GalNAc-alpha-(1->3)-diNAcBac-PP-undecaprenol alpha-1,4-N-acetyl-D-galactosaminyltransferase